MESKQFYKHDSNSRNSAKILRVRARFHAAGYGIYHMLLERLRDEESHISDADYEMLSMDIQESPDMIRSVVEDFGLFELSEDGTKFWSPEFLRRLGPSDELRATRAEAGRKGAQSRWAAKNGKTTNIMALNGKTMANHSKSGKVAISEGDDSLPFENNKNTNTIAQGGKIMANDSNCHNTEKPEMAKLWQNPAQNGIEWQNEGKEREEEKEIYKEKEKKSFFSKRNGDLPSDETRVQIIEKFFFRNWASPSEEYKRLVAYNGSERWAQMSVSEQLDAAELWRQQPEQPGRFDSRFIKVWRRVYEKFKEEMDVPLRLAFIDDSIAFSHSGTIATLTCPKAVYDFIEGPGRGAHYNEYKLILIPFMKTIHCSSLKYVWNNPE